MIRIGLIGAGFIGTMHSEVYHNLPNAEVIAVTDVREEKAKAIVVKHGAKLCSGAEEILNNKQVDVIDVCLPTYMHREYALKAAQTGKHIVCEKPIALTSEEADEMVNAAEKAGVELLVGHVIRFWPEYVRLKEIIEKRELGQLLSIYCLRLSPTPTYTWNNWILDQEKSKGALVDLHIHDTDYLIYLFGFPVSLYSQGVKTSRGWEHIVTQFEFPGNVLAVAEGGWNLPGSFPFTMAFTAVFEKGAVEYNIRHEKTMAIHQEGTEVEYPSFQEEGPSSADAGGNISALGGYFLELKYFVECLEKGTKPVFITPESAKKSLEVVLKEEESAEKGEKIKL